MAQQEGVNPKAPKTPLRSSRDIQGNILAPFNKPFQAFLFLNFRNDGASAREWLDSLVPADPPPADDRPADDSPLIAVTEDVADHNDQVSTSRRPTQRKEDTPPPRHRCWLAVSFTRSGLVTLHPELAADLMQFQAFWEGPLGTRRDEYGNVTTTAALLGDKGDSDPDHWVVGGPRQDPVDALVTLAADEEAQLDGLVNQLVELAGQYQQTKVGRLLVLLEQRGKAPRMLAERQGLFKFKEGVSQPGVLGFTPAKRRHRRLEDADHPGSPIIATGEFLLGYPGERRVDLRARPPATPAWMRDGSFQVFRRLTHNPDDWDRQMAMLTEKAGITSEKLEAKAVGRHPNGCPLAPDAGCDPADSNPDNDTLNDFDYAADPEGVHTPLFAHIRRMNPRDERVFYRARRLLRRGITFEDSGNDQGLLFNAFMASIEDQFEYLMRYWANGLGLDGTGAGDGPDPLIGKRASAETRWVLRLPGGYHQLLSAEQLVAPTGAVYASPQPTQRQLTFDQVVQTSGAVYAFAPSIPTLRRLAQDPARVEISRA
jgi:deferrochelatase/peroxidase EfeB